jgi:O-antigen ligase
MSSLSVNRPLRLAPYWVLAFVALWPTVGVAEAFLALGAVFAVLFLLWQKIRHQSQGLSREAWLMTLAFFLVYWLPELFSAFDAIDAKKAWREVLLDLRYLPFLWLTMQAVAHESGRKIVFSGIAIVTLFWTLDGLIQVFTGWSIGGAMTQDRLSGIFGSDNLKLGLVIAVLSPFALHWAHQQWQRLGWYIAAFTMGVVILWAGARAAWLMYAMVLFISGWRLLNKKQWTLFIALLLSLLALSYVASPQLRARFDRTEQVMQGNTQTTDHALSGRISIWRAALGMVQDHPVNGVGIRNFRMAYPNYAAADDPFMTDGQQGAFHAHHWVLEVLSETGFVGLICWLAGLYAMWRAWRWSPARAREFAFTPMISILVMLFPLNTHLAFYSTFWGGCWLLLLAIYAGCLGAHDRFSHEKP